MSSSKTSRMQDGRAVSANTQGLGENFDGCSRVCTMTGELCSAEDVLCMRFLSFLNMVRRLHNHHHKAKVSKVSTPS